ncbi:MAG TPA: hypothetical protein VMS98_19300 [Thermoanaerobaculia bacterium]|nr:hypothetical protein [Thermoanaerobaculia bacterium]
METFSGDRFTFSPGIRAGDVVSIRDGDGNVRITYRSFAGIVGIVAALVAAIVLTAGAAATLFLIADGRNGPAAVAAILSVAFSVVIAGLVPPVRVTLYEASIPVLAIAQQSRFSIPFVTYAVTTPDGNTVGTLRTGILSRLGRNRWRIAGPEQYPVANAIEESFGRAFVRKLLGKFNRQYQSNLVILQDDVEAGLIVRRPDEEDNYDFLEMSPGASLDRRVAVALATLVFGAEP